MSFLVLRIYKLLNLTSIINEDYLYNGVFHARKLFLYIVQTNEMLIVMFIEDETTPSKWHIY